jgi:glycosyltransferase involved in cell wall biosynthesis
LGGNLALSHPAIVVVAYDRPESLRRLLRSLLAADYPETPDLVISIDGGGNDNVVEVAKECRWPHGKKEIIRRPENLGLRAHILACGDLTDVYDTIIVLEDDLFVSPAFYHFAVRASNFYKDRPEIGGIGLYSYRRNLASGMLFEPLLDEADCLFLQFACSWGQVWSSSQWKPFRQWYDDHMEWNPVDPRVPAYVGRWPKSSWLKYHIKYLIDTNRYFVSPRASFATCFQDAGHHTDSQTPQHQVSLQLTKRNFVFKHLNDSFCVYDAWHTLVPDRLSRLAPGLRDYDYTIDFFGLKPLDQLSLPFVLACGTSSAPILEFGLQMRPAEMNVIAGVPGRGIILSRTTDIVSTAALSDHAVRLYSELGARRLFQMLQKKLFDKVGSRFRTLKFR